MLIAIAQLNFIVGDIEGNTEKIIHTANSACLQKAEMIVFSELCLCGYPPEDLLLRPQMISRIKIAYQKICTVKNIVLIIGFPWATTKGLENRIQAILNGQILCNYAKQQLPNYSVFDEKRYFIQGRTHQKNIFNYKNIQFGIGICEDFWHLNTILNMPWKHTNIVLNPSASPFHNNKQQERYKIMQNCCLQKNVSMIYVNQIGGQDELVFDGQSFAMQASGEICMMASAFQEQINYVNYDNNNHCFNTQYINCELSPDELIYQALVTGLRDYVEKNHLNGVILGLSGGIDSALVLAIAVDALGADRVTAVMMPFKYTANMSLEDANWQASRLKVKYLNLPIELIFNAVTTTLPTNNDYTEQNLQARIRGTLLMALANQNGNLLLTTGNKSEMATGYTTLYGDMAGGFAILKDVYKTMVYHLAKWRNKSSVVIPLRTIQRPPSAELSPGQLDSDSLPPYEILDKIIYHYVEEDQDIDAIVQAGFDREIVAHSISLIDKNEFKRRQSAIGIRITGKAFGRDRRYPITSEWNKNLR